MKWIYHHLCEQVLLFSNIISNLHVVSTLWTKLYLFVTSLVTPQDFRLTANFCHNIDGMLANYFPCVANYRVPSFNSKIVLEQLVCRLHSFSRKLNHFFSSKSSWPPKIQPNDAFGWVSGVQLGVWKMKKTN